jgi:hypothetical protein
MEGQSNYWRQIVQSNFKSIKNIISNWDYLIKNYDRKDVNIDSCPKTFNKYKNLREWRDCVLGLVNSLESYEHAMVDQLLSQGKLITRLMDENDYLRSELNTTNRINLFYTTRKTKTQNESEQIQSD